LSFRQQLLSGLCCPQEAIGLMNCEETQELLEAYGLGVLEPEVAVQVKEHLASCDRCRALAQSYAETLAAIPETLATVSPYAMPTTLRQKLLAQVAGAPQDEHLHQTGDVLPPLARQAPPLPQPPVARAVSDPGRASSVPRLRLALIATCVLLVMLLLWSLRLNSVLARERALRAEFRGLVDQQEIVLEVIDSNQTVRRVLLPPAGDSRAYGKVFSRSDMAHVVAMAARLPVPAPGEAYHLWLTRDGQTFLAGTLRTNDEGFGLLVYDDAVDGPVYDRALVTLQPVGSATPVELPVLEWLLEEQEE
jgi:hypothetical protein